MAPWGSIAAVCPSPFHDAVRRCHGCLGGRLGASQLPGRALLLCMAAGRPFAPSAGVPCPSESVLLDRYRSTCPCHSFDIVFTLGRVLLDHRSSAHLFIKRHHFSVWFLTSTFLPSKQLSRRWSGWIRDILRQIAFWGDTKTLRRSGLHSNTSPRTWMLHTPY